MALKAALFEQVLFVVRIGVLLNARKGPVLRSLRWWLASCDELVVKSDGVDNDVTG